MDVFAKMENEKNQKLNIQKKFKKLENGRILLSEPKESTKTNKKFCYKKPSHICTKTGYFAKRRANKFVSFIQKDLTGYITEIAHWRNGDNGKYITLAGPSWSEGSGVLVVKDGKIKKLKRMLKKVNFKLIEQKEQDKILQDLIKITSRTYHEGLQKLLYILNDYGFAPNYFNGRHLETRHLMETAICCTPILQITKQEAEVFFESLHSMFLHEFEEFVCTRSDLSLTDSAVGYADKKKASWFAEMLGTLFVYGKISLKEDTLNVIGDRFLFMSYPNEQVFAEYTKGRVLKKQIQQQEEKKTEAQEVIDKIFEDAQNTL